MNYNVSYRGDEARAAAVAARAGQLVVLTNALAASVGLDRMTKTYDLPTGEVVHVVVQDFSAHIYIDASKGPVGDQPKDESQEFGYRTLYYGYLLTANHNEYSLMWASGEGRLGKKESWTRMLYSDLQSELGLGGPHDKTLKGPYLSSLIPPPSIPAGVVLGGGSYTDYLYDWRGAGDLFLAWPGQSGRSARFGKYSLQDPTYDPVMGADYIPYTQVDNWIYDSRLSGFVSIPVPFGGFIAGAAIFRASSDDGRVAFVPVVVIMYPFEDATLVSVYNGADGVVQGTVLSLPHPIQELRAAWNFNPTGSQAQYVAPRASYTRSYQDGDVSTDVYEFLRFELNLYAEFGESGVLSVVPVFTKIDNEFEYSTKYKVDVVYASGTSTSQSIPYYKMTPKPGPTPIYELGQIYRMFGSVGDSLESVQSKWDAFMANSGWSPSRFSSSYTWEEIPAYISYYVSYSVPAVSSDIEYSLTGTVVVAADYSSDGDLLVASLTLDQVEVRTAHKGAEQSTVSVSQEVTYLTGSRWYLCDGSTVQHTYTDFRTVSTGTYTDGAYVGHASKNRWSATLNLPWGSIETLKAEFETIDVSEPSRTGVADYPLPPDVGGIIIDNLHSYKVMCDSETLPNTKEARYFYTMGEENYPHIAARGVAEGGEHGVPTYEHTTTVHGMLWYKWFQMSHLVHLDLRAGVAVVATSRETSRDDGTTISDGVFSVSVHKSGSAEPQILAETEATHTINPRSSVVFPQTLPVVAAATTRGGSFIVACKPVTVVTGNSRYGFIHEGLSLSDYVSSSDIEESPEAQLLRSEDELGGINYVEISRPN